MRSKLKESDGLTDDESFGQGGRETQESPNPKLPKGGVSRLRGEDLQRGRRMVIQEMKFRKGKAGRPLFMPCFRFFSIMFPPPPPASNYPFAPLLQ